MYMTGQQFHINALNGLVKFGKSHSNFLDIFAVYSLFDSLGFGKDSLDLIFRNPRQLNCRLGTTFILPHVANYAEDLDSVSRLLAANPNVHIDFSARLDELGRQPYRAREFFLRWQDRILFGTDMPASAEMYRCYFRFLETFDEYFFPPDYDGSFDRRRWAICGIGLPPEVLAKVYYRNAVRIIPGLKDDLAGRLPDDDS